MIISSRQPRPRHIPLALNETRACPGRDPAPRPADPEGAGWLQDPDWAIREIVDGVLFRPARETAF